MLELWLLAEVLLFPEDQPFTAGPAMLGKRAGLPGEVHQRETINQIPLLMTVLCPASGLELP